MIVVGRAVTACVALGLSAACLPGEPNAEWGGTTTDSAGVVLVENPTTPLWQESNTWRLVEDLRIGGLAGDSNYQFGQVGGIAVDSHGDIYVVDRQARDLRIYSPDGLFLRSIGSPGSGPGEFGRAVSDVLIAEGDTVLVPDIQNRRINRFAPDGSDLSSVPLDLDRQRALRFRAKSKSGTMAVQLRPTESAAGATVGLDAIRRIEPSGRLGDTLLSVPSGSLIDGNRLHYFTPEPMWSLTDSGTVIYAVNSEYRIQAYDRAGTLRRITSLAFDPKSITDRDIRAFFAYLDRAWLDAGVPASRLKANHDRVSFAEVFPAFSIFHVGYRGSLWVQPVRSPSSLSDEEIERYNFLEDFGDSNWSVFDADGRFLGEVIMPERFQPRTFIDDQIFGVWRDELDVQYVMVLRVVAG